MLGEAARQQLQGKNLACWCSLPEAYADQECFAAVLLKIANNKNSVLDELDLTQHIDVHTMDMYMIKQWRNYGCYSC